LAQYEKRSDFTGAGGGGGVDDDDCDVV